jgi:hypothetical protein
LKNRKTTALSITAIMAVAILAIGVATTVSSVNSAYAWSNSKNIKQTKVVVINKCANVDDENKRTHIQDVRCEINHDTIVGTSSLLTDGNIKIDSTK